MAFPTPGCYGGTKLECKSGRCGKRARLAGEQLDIAKFTVLLLLQKMCLGVIASCKHACIFQRVGMKSTGPLKAIIYVGKLDMTLSNGRFGDA